MVSSTESSNGNMLTSDVTTWIGSSLLSVTQLSPDGLSLLFRVADEMKHLVEWQKYGTKCGGKNGNGNGSRTKYEELSQLLKHQIMATIFYEASTRTSCSFQAAMLRLGGQVMTVDASSKGNTSASAKGESLSDTLRCLECYVDVLVVRHFQRGALQTTSLVADPSGSAPTPLLNAGDGDGEHPTQALLDLYTIYRGEGVVSCLPTNGSGRHLIIVLLGDLKHGRTVHSLTKLLAQVVTSGLDQVTHITLRLCAPDGLGMPSSIIDFVQTNGHKASITVDIYSDITKALPGAHVLYVTRIQRERFERPEDYDNVKGAYVVTPQLLQSYGHDLKCILHPLPRVDEIDTTVDTDPRAAYFRQMTNGMYIRMALIALMVKGMELQQLLSF